MSTPFQKNDVRKTSGFEKVNGNTKLIEIGPRLVMKAQKAVKNTVLGIFLKKCLDSLVKPFLNLFVKDVVPPNHPLKRVIDFT